MLKRTLCAALILLMLACAFPMAAMADASQEIQPHNKLSFSAFMTILGEEGTYTDHTEAESQSGQSNDTLSDAEYLPQDRTIVNGNVCSEDDAIDYFKITLDHSCFIDFLGASSANNRKSSLFQLLDSTGEEILTATYYLTSSGDDYFVFNTTLPAGTYYLGFTDPVGPITYQFTFILTEALDAPEVTPGGSASGKPVLTWDAVDGASGYQIYRAESGSGSFALLEETEETSYIDTTAAGGKVYDYKVIALSSNTAVKNSGYSAPVSAASILTAPEAALSVSTTTGKPTVEWTTAEGAVEYHVYRSTSKSGDYEVVGTGITGETYTDETAAAGTTYYYKVMAVGEHSAANSGFSNVVSGLCKLANPTVTITGSSSSGKPVVKWKTVEGAAKYRIYRSTKKTSGFKLVKTAITARSYTDTDAVVGTNYYYKIMAIHENSAADSGYSAVVNRVCDLKQPVVTLKVDTASGKPKVTFEKISGAQKYYIVRATSEDGTYSKLATITGTSYTDKTAEAGVEYFYKVKALHSKDSADSAYSAITSRVCDLAKPVVSIKLSSGNPRLTWNKIEGAEKYYVYRATSKDGEYTWVKTTKTASSFTDTDVKAGKTYYYKVKAVHENTDANSAYSSVKYIKAK